MFGFITVLLQGSYIRLISINLVLLSCRFRQFRGSRFLNLILLTLNRIGFFLSKWDLFLYLLFFLGFEFFDFFSWFAVPLLALICLLWTWSLSSYQNWLLSGFIVEIIKKFYVHGLKTDRNIPRNLVIIFRFAFFLWLRMRILKGRLFIFLFVYNLLRHSKKN